jgi:hypothetical protein
MKVSEGVRTEALMGAVGDYGYYWLLYSDVVYIGINNSEEPAALPIF